MRASIAEAIFGRNCHDKNVYMSMTASLGGQSLDLLTVVQRDSQRNEGKQVSVHISSYQEFNAVCTAAE